MTRAMTVLSQLADVVTGMASTAPLVFLGAGVVMLLLFASRRRRTVFFSVLSQGLPLHPEPEPVVVRHSSPWSRLVR